MSHSRHLKAYAELIADLWCIGIKKAKATLEADTQQGIKYAILTLSRRYRYNRVYILNKINARFATYTIFSDINSLNHNLCGKVFSHKVGLSAAYSM